MKTEGETPRNALPVGDFVISRKAREPEKKKRNLCWAGPPLARLVIELFQYKMEVVDVNLYFQIIVSC